MDSPPSSLTPHSDTGEAEKFTGLAPGTPLEPSSPLPETYGDDRLVALVRDPRCVFVYWEMTDGNAQRMRHEGGQDIWDNAPLVLRVYDVSEPPRNGIESCPFFDVEVRKDARQWYVMMPENGGSAHVIDLGLRRSDGRFFSLLRSNRVSLPAGRISNQLDAQFAAVRAVPGTAEDPQAFFARDVQRIAAGSADFSRSMAQRWEFLRSVFSGSPFRLPSSNEKKP